MQIRGRQSRPIRWVHHTLGISASLAVLGSVASPGQAQGPLDMFGSHYGGVRTPRIAPQSWVSFSAMLLTQLDGRWDPLRNDGSFINYDSLQTTVGYNYVTGGHQFVFNNALPRGTAITVATSAHIGWTCDECVVRPVQDALHNFLQIPHVARQGVASTNVLAGLDVQALVWPRRGRWAVGPHASFGTYHREVGATALGRIPWSPWRLGRFILMPQITVGVLGSKGIKPRKVGDRLDAEYWSVRGTVEWAETLGFSAVWSDGIFIDESELLLSGYFTAQLTARNWLRLEFVNDLLNDKDRGPTGGGRVVWSYRH